MRSDKPEPFDLEESIGNLDDALRIARELVSALECAETVESERDFRANVGEAKVLMKQLSGELNELPS
jgi:hypothetical protein